MNSAPPLLGDVLLLCIVGVMGIHALSLLRRGRLLLLDPLFAFWAGILVIYVGQPLANSRVFIEWHNQDVFISTLAWTVLGLVCVIVGYEWNLGLLIGRKLPQAPARLAAQKLSFAGFGFILLGLLGYLYLFESAGGVGAWLEVPRGGTDYDNVSAYVAQMAELLPLGMILLLFQMNFHPTPLWRKVAIWLMAALVWWWFLYLGSRSKLIAFTIAALCACYLPKRKSPPLALASAVFLGLFVVSNFQEHYRDKFTDLSLNLDQIDTREAWGNILPTYLGGDKSLQGETVAPGVEFNCVMTVVELVPAKVPYNYGYGYLEIFTRWIPRTFWPEKSYPQMEAVQGVLQEGLLSDSIVRDTGLLMGPAFTFVGHWFYVGGPVGLIFGGLITGVLFRLIRTIHDRGRRSEGDILIYASLIGLGFTEAASTPFAWLSTMPFVLGPLALILFLCRAPAKNPRPRQPLPALMPAELNRA
jgi:hypothetical protein